MHGAGRADATLHPRRPPRRRPARRRRQRAHRRAGRARRPRGAHFGTAPATNTEVLWACRELELPSFPGAATPSELERLALLGVPAPPALPDRAAGRWALVAAVAATSPRVRFLPSGGIGPEALRAYLNEPAVLAVAVGGVLREELLRSRGHSRIEWLARAKTGAGGPYPYGFGRFGDPLDGCRRDRQARCRGVPASVPLT